MRAPACERFHAVECGNPRGGQIGDVVGRKKRSVPTNRSGWCSPQATPCPSRKASVMSSTSLIAAARGSRPGRTMGCIRRSERKPAPRTAGTGWCRGRIRRNQRRPGLPAIRPRTAGPYASVQQVLRSDPRAVRHGGGRADPRPAGWRHASPLRDLVRSGRRTAPASGCRGAGLRGIALTFLGVLVGDCDGDTGSGRTRSRLYRYGRWYGLSAPGGAAAYRCACGPARRLAGSAGWSRPPRASWMSSSGGHCAASSAAYWLTGSRASARRDWRQRS